MGRPGLCWERLDEAQHSPRLEGRGRAGWGQRSQASSQKRLKSSGVGWSEGSLLAQDGERPAKGIGGGIQFRVVLGGRPSTLLHLSMIITIVPRLNEVQMNHFSIKIKKEKL